MPGPKVTWTPEEDVIMMKVLREEKDAGNQSDSGWKKVVWMKVEQSLQQAGYSGKTASKCSDHYAYLKTAFKEVLELHEKSGFSWDPIKKMVKVDHEQVWADLLAVDSNKKFKKWRKQSFSCFDDMNILVGGILATGAGAFRAGQGGGQGAGQGGPSNVQMGPSTAVAYDVDEKEEDVPIPDNMNDVMDTGDSWGNNLTQVIVLGYDSDLELASPSASGSDKNKRKLTSASTSSSMSTGTTSYKRKKRTSNAEKDPFENLSNSIHSLGSQFQSNSPARRQKAIQLLETDGDFSEDESIKVIALFTTNTAAADSFCAIGRKEARTKFARHMIPST